ncbi:MAG: hypothetical protein V7K69_14890 [Nostoc sp.]
MNGVVVAHDGAEVGVQDLALLRQVWFKYMKTAVNYRERQLH